MKTRLICTHGLMLAFIILGIAGCAGHSVKQAPGADLAVQAENLDETPQPIGGLQAVMAAIRYPEEAEKKHLEGVVMVSVLVDAAGRVEETRIAKSSGHGVLDDEALITVARVRWQAGRRDGKAINSWTTVPVEFRLE